MTQNNDAVAMVFSASLRQVHGNMSPRGKKLAVQPVNKLVHARKFTWKNNMADETQEVCSFHEMSLDDRLIKVNSIF